MLIIVEGPDGAGKSTFVQALRDRLGGRSAGLASVEVLHARPPKDHPLNEYEKPLLRYLPGVAEHVICDRWHWGESVYPGVLRRQTQYDLAVRRHVELFLRSRGAVVAYLDTPWEVAAARVNVRGDDYVHASQVRALKAEYDLVARRSLLPVWKVRADFGDGDVRAVIEVARFNEQLVRSLSAFTTYVGPADPAVLLLGDVRHEVRPGHVTAADFDTRWPAFGPFPATSGHYLLSHLRTVRRLGLANACDVDDWRVLRAVLGNPVIVTLGAHATRRVRGRVPEPSPRFGSAPHPQFVRRFYHRHDRDYAEVIQRASEGEDLVGWRP